jgi:hypothetical protein
VGSLCQHDQEIDQRPSGDCGHKSEEEQLDRFVSFVFDHHFRDHLAKGAAGAAIPDATVRDFGFWPEEMIGLGESVPAPGPRIMPGELMFGFRSRGWLHVVSVGSV